MKSSLRNAINCHEHNFHPKRHTSMSACSVRDVAPSPSSCFCALHSMRQVAQSQAVVASQPQQQNIFPCGHALKIGIDSLDSPPRHLHYFLTGPISNQHLLLRAQSCSVKRHQWRHGWFCHCLHARVYYEFCFASVNGKWI